LWITQNRRSADEYWAEILLLACCYQEVSRTAIIEPHDAVAWAFADLQRMLPFLVDDGSSGAAGDFPSRIFPDRSQVETFG
jgi:hypothetical protein